MTAPDSSTADVAMSPLKRAFLALEAANARVAELEAAANAPIAIVGLGCRTPGGVHDSESFWQLLDGGVDAISAVPASRWDADALFDANPDAAGRIVTRHGGFLDSIDTFDSTFFGIAPREAQGMDPQQRLLLEVTWEALENAGQAPDRLQRSATGVFIGACASDYAFMQLMSGDRQLLDAHFTSGMAHSVLSGRLSYVLGLQGPSITYDTACSSSLVAVHQACAALRANECRMAIAGGVNLILSPDLYIALSHSRMLAPDGRCKTFDAAADGFARGEGCGVLVLKRLSDAEADGDRVLAVIRGSAVNQDGPSSSLTAPNGPSQEAVIRQALAKAGIEPRQVGFVEAHGTGTQLGDPLEVHALGAVFGADRPVAAPLVIGSVKTNIGHLEAAAGIVGLIKLVLSLQHKTIPAHLHFREPSPHIGWADLPLQVPALAMPWNPIDGRRIGGVSSFGFSGTNAHIVIEEAPPSDVPVATESELVAPALFVLSARDETALAALAERYLRAIKHFDDDQLQDVCRTASTGRARFACRATVVAESMPALRTALQALSAGEADAKLRITRSARREPPRVAFLFTGQGAQYVQMSAGLYRNSTVFRAALDRCATALAPHVALPLLDVLFPQPGASTPIDETAYTQPALFAVEYALAEMWRALGVTPHVVMGHSVGEIAAACVAGVMSLAEAARLVAVRGRLLQSLPPGGAMAAIGAAESTVRAVLGAHVPTVSVATVNGPLQTVISGLLAEVQTVCQEFTTAGTRCTQLTVSHAFHSPLVDAVLDPFEREASAVRFAPPQLKLISNLTGRLASGAELGTGVYWRRHVREAVRFSDGLQSLMDLRPDVLIEVGPHPVLLSFASNALGDGCPTRVASLRERADDWTQFLDAVASLYHEGANIEWDALYAGRARRTVALPSYPFQRERHWFNARRLPAIDTGVKSGHPLLGSRLRLAGTTIVFESTLSADDPAFVREHQVLGRVVLPATAYLDMLMAAGRIALRHDTISVSDVVVQEAMMFEANDARRVVQTVLGDPTDGSIRISISSAEEVAEAGNSPTEWTTHVTALLRTAVALPSNEEDVLATLRTRCSTDVTVSEFYAGFEKRGLNFGADFRSIRRLSRCDGEAIALVELTSTLTAASQVYRVHPVLLDGCLQTIAAALPESDDDSLYLPIGIASYRISGNTGNRCWSHVAVRESATEIRQADIHVYNERGAVVAELTGVQLKRVTRDALERLGERALDATLYETRWESTSVVEPTMLIEASPVALVRELTPELPVLFESAGIRNYDTFLNGLEQLCGMFTVHAMHTFGWSPTVGDTVEETSLTTQLGVAPLHRQLFGRLLAILAEDGLVARGKSAGEWRVTRTFPTVDTVAAAERLRASCPPGASAELEMTVRVASSLAEAMRGEFPPMQLLFPDGSLEIAERMYRDSPTARFYNGLMAAAVSRVVREAISAAAGRPVRILEVGAGTGGTTAHVLPLLPNSGVEYTFTDVGPLFVARASERFKSHPAMRFATLDLERDLSEQGFPPAHFDVVIASNVIHATADLRRTLGRVRSLLAPGGLLALLEVTTPQRWFDLTVGLTEGWWAFTDTDIRPDYATLSSNGWARVLVNSGFDEVAAIPAPGQDALATQGSLSKQSVVLARAATSLIAAKPARYVVFADEGETSQVLLALMQQRGDTYVRVRPGAYHFQHGEASVSTANAEDYGRLLRDSAARMGGIDGVVHAWSLDCPTYEQAPDADGLNPAGVLSAMRTAQALAAFESAPPRLLLVTRGAQAATGDEHELAPAQAAVCGLGRTIMLEHPELHCVCLDLDAPAASDAPAIMAELQTEPSEPAIALRHGKRLSARLARARREPLARATSQSWELVPEQAGVLDRFVRKPVARRIPAAGEVEIAVESTGLNFKDVLNVLGMYPGNPGALGGECAGRVLSVGAGVTHVRAGDAVMAVAGGSFSSHVIANAELVQRRPEGVSADEGASFSIPFLTAEVCLVHFARLNPGERVLIHAAAGGVGMAAVRVAQRIGAEVFATAGSERKRALLREMGVQHVFDSRDASFAAAVQEVTQSRGVDVVLNSLTGDQLDASFTVLARGGRFVEIGKRGIRDDAWVAAQQQDWSYFVVDWGEMAANDPALIGDMFAALVDDLRHGRLKPLPRHVFSLDHATRAFRFMAQARHTGKIVVRHDSSAPLSIRRDGTYLVTGGLSGLGLRVAQWLSAEGAGRLVLVGRRGITAAAKPVIAKLEAAGTTVIAQALDVSDRSALNTLLQRIRAQGPPLRGVMHSAGVLNDASLLQQDEQRFAEVFAPKTCGAGLLDTLTRPDALDWFVMFSSIASVLGSPGQSNHSAANASLDLLAHARRRNGLPAISINWGAWTEVGAAADRGITDRLSAQGVGAMSPAQGLLALKRLMESDRVQTTVLPIDWQRYLQHRMQTTVPAFLQNVVQQESPGAAVSDLAPAAASAARASDFRASIAEAPEARRRPMVAAFVRDRALRALGMDAMRAVDPRTPLGDFGLDSLLSVELRNTLSGALQHSLPATLLFDYPTIDALTDFLMKEVPGLGSAAIAAEEPPADTPTAASLVGSIEELSDDEVDRLLAARAAQGATN